MEDNYREKYLKYKIKYLELKENLDNQEAFGKVKKLDPKKLQPIFNYIETGKTGDKKPIEYYTSKLPEKFLNSEKEEINYIDEILNYFNDLEYIIKQEEIMLNGEIEDAKKPITKKDYSRKNKEEYTRLSKQKRERLERAYKRLSENRKKLYDISQRKKKLESLLNKSLTNKTI